MKHKDKKKGFTGIELLIVVAVLAILFAIVLPQLNLRRETHILSSALSDILSSIGKARTQTLASLDSSSYGVHFEPDEVIIFKGTSFSSGNSENEIIPIPAPASISSVTLGGSSGNSGSFYFERLTGDPSAWGTITVTTPSSSKIITISATGSASAN